MKGIWKEILGQETEVGHNPHPSESGIGIDQILSMRLSELSKRNLGLKIYSEVMGCEIWLCGNERIAAQLRQDGSAAVVYTADEMRRLIKVNPASEDFKGIHNAKTVFPGSKVADGRLKETCDKPDRTQSRMTTVTSAMRL